MSPMLLEDALVMLLHVMIEQVVLSFFSLAERRRNFDIEFCMVFMSSLSELERLFFFSFLLVVEPQYEDREVDPADWAWWAKLLFSCKSLSYKNIKSFCCDRIVFAVVLELELAFETVVLAFALPSLPQRSPLEGAEDDEQQSELSIIERS